MNNWHPWRLKKIKILGAVFGATSQTALPKKWTKLAKLAVLFSWQLQNGPQDFDFFQLSWVPIIHLSLIPLRPKPPQFFGHNNLFLGGVSTLITKIDRYLIPRLGSYGDVGKFINFINNMSGIIRCNNFVFKNFYGFKNQQQKTSRF